MAYGLELDHLAGRWAERHESTVFAALAEGLRKRGALDEAVTVAVDGLARFPEFLPGYVALARIRRDAGDFVAAEVTLQAALAHDPADPVVLDELVQLGERIERSPDPRPPAPEDTLNKPVISGQPELDSDQVVYADGAFDGDDFADLSEPLVTESLALLYQGQGHLERALEVFSALLARDPGNADLAARRNALRVQLAGRRPRPYDAAQSGGQSVGEWLATIAAARPTAERTLTGYDAFFESGDLPRNGSDDLEAFQLWLRELAR